VYIYDIGVHEAGFVIAFKTVRVIEYLAQLPILLGKVPYGPPITANILASAIATMKFDGHLHPPRLEQTP
jgi:hypothetical protein